MQVSPTLKLDDGFFLPATALLNHPAVYDTITHIIRHSVYPIMETGIRCEHILPGCLCVSLVILLLLLLTEFTVCSRGAMGERQYAKPLHSLYHSFHIASVS